MIGLSHQIILRAEDSADSLKLALGNFNAPKVSELENIYKKYSQLESEVKVICMWLETAIDDIRNETYIVTYNDDDPNDDDPEQEQEEQQQVEEDDEPHVATDKVIHQFKTKN